MVEALSNLKLDETATKDSNTNKECKYLPRFGVCLEPATCQGHKLSLESADFIPKKKQNSQGQQKFEDKYEIQMTQEEIEQEINENFDDDEEEDQGGDIDQEMVFLEICQDCECCKGLVNNCNG